MLLILRQFTLEVVERAKELGSDISYDKTSSVKWMVYGANQWISWDDAQSFEDKKKFMSSRCLKGLMVWELGLDSADYQALIGLFGEEAVSKGLSDASLNPEEREQLTLDLSAYNGQFCYVAEQCVTSDKDNGDDKGHCMAGYSVIETAQYVPFTVGLITRVSQSPIRRLTPLGQKFLPMMMTNLKCQCP